MSTSARYRPYPSTLVGEARSRRWRGGIHGASWRDINRAGLPAMTEEEISRALASFQKAGHDATGWDTLYRDAATGELWEVIYPHGEMHGGGPRHLTAISITDARAKYPGLVD